MAKFNALDTHGYVLAILEADDEVSADLYRLRQMQPQCARVVAVAGTGGDSATLTEAQRATATAQDRLAESLQRLGLGKEAATAQATRGGTGATPTLRESLARLGVGQAGLDTAVAGRQRGLTWTPPTIVVPRQEAKLLAGSRASSGATLRERGRQRGAGLGRLTELREGGKVVGWQVPAGHRA